MSDVDETSSKPGMPELIKLWREGRDPREVPELWSLPEHMRRSQALTQTMVASLLGITERHYRRIESGERGLSARLLDELTRILGLPEAERSALYLWAGHEPPHVHPAPDVDESLMQFVEEQPHSAYWSDLAYDVKGFNQQAARHLPWLTSVDANVMIELLAPEGTGRRMLRRWDDLWVPAMVAQLRLAQVRYPDNPRLAEVVREVRHDPVVRRVWNEPNLRARVQPLDDVRPLLLPTYDTGGPVWMRLLTFSPLHRPDLRLVVISPVSHSGDPTGTTH